MKLILKTTMTIFVIISSIMTCHKAFAADDCNKSDFPLALTRPICTINDLPKDILVSCFLSCGKELPKVRVVCVNWCRTIEDEAEFPQTLFLYAVPNDQIDFWLKSAYESTRNFKNLYKSFDKDPASLERLQLYANHLSPGQFGSHHPDKISDEQKKKENSPYTMTIKDASPISSNPFFCQIALVHLCGLDVSKGFGKERDAFQRFITDECTILQKSASFDSDWESKEWLLSREDQKKKKKEKYDTSVSLWKPWVKFAEYSTYNADLECALMAIIKFKLEMPIEQFCIFKRLWQSNYIQKKTNPGFIFPYIVRTYEDYIKYDCGKTEIAREVFDFTYSIFKANGLLEQNILQNPLTERLFLRVLGSLKDMRYSDERDRLLKLLYENTEVTKDQDID